MTEYLTDAIPVVDVAPTENDLIWDFVRKQIHLWGDEAVQRMFDQGFDAQVVNGKVLWVK